MATSRSIGGPPTAYLKYRRNQLDLILSRVDLPSDACVLEIGGGVSGQSMLLADLAAMVICADLLKTDTSYGAELSLVATLARARDDRRVRYVCGRAEQIPLCDESVDVVFSSYVFEHLADRDAAAREIARVLRPGGLVVTNVPNRPEPVTRALGFYTSRLPRQFAKAALSWTPLGRVIPVRPRTQSARPSSLGEITAWLRSVMTYPTHGVYRSHVDEIIQSSPREWNMIFQRAGLHVVQRFSIRFEDYFALFSPRLAYWWQERLLGATARFGGTSLGVMLGHSYCVVAEKPSSA